MKSVNGSIRHQLNKVYRDQRGITGLETAIVLIAFVVVAAVFAFAVITTGLFSSEKAAATASAGLGEASTTLLPKGAVVGVASPGNDAIATIKYKVTNSGAESVALAAANTLLTYSDQNNLTTLVRSANASGSGETAPWWWTDWKLGTGDSLDSGEVVEITIGLLTTVDSTTTVNETGPYAAGDVTLTVADGTQFTAGDSIYIDSERLDVTAVVGNNLTVTRGVNGTSDVAHADLLPISIVQSQLPTNLGVNMPFKVELIPTQGAPFTLTRTSPVELTSIMDLG